MRQHSYSLVAKIDVNVTSVFTSRKLSQSLSVKENKPPRSCILMSMWFVWRKLCQIGFVHNFFLQLYRRCTTVHNFIPETFCKNNCYNQRLWNRTFSGTLFTSWKYVNDVTISAIVPACGWRLNSIFISYRVASQSQYKVLRFRMKYRKSWN